MVSSLALFSSIIVIVLLPIASNADLRTLYETQVHKEFLASNTYLTFAHRLATRGVYNGFAKFFFDSAEEERDHGKKLLDFYNVRNRDINLPFINVDEDIATMDDLTKMIKKAEEMERDVFNNLIQARGAASDEKDYATVHFIETQLLEEQTTALKLMNDLVKRIERNPENSIVLLQMMDQELRDRKIAKP